MEKYNLTNEYTICLDKIREMRIKKIEWEQILKARDNEFFEIMFPNDYKEKWNYLVNYMRNMEEDTESHTGYVYSNDIKNIIEIPVASDSAWNTFKNNCLSNYGQETIESSQNSARKVLERVKMESYEKEPGKGLVMGYVQSGKTMNIESVITLAADYGFNIFIMLSGTIENLRRQNLKRLQNDIEFSKNSNMHWKFFDNIKDPTSKISGILQNDRARIVTVCLKNCTRLKNLKNWLIEDTDALTKKKMKILFIDDEADQASLNTKDIDDDENPSKINKLIVEILKCKEFQAMNYISYTATPYGNFLNEHSEKSLYPRNFIISLPKSKQYIGASEIFGIKDNNENIDNHLNILREISKNDYNILKNIEQDGFVMPDSLIDAISWFLVTLAIQRNKGSKKPVSMLIHTNNKQTIHTLTGKAITSWINNNKKLLKDKCKDVYESETKKFTKADFIKVMPLYNNDGMHEIKDYPKYNEIEDELNKILNYPVTPIETEDDGKLQFHKGIHVVIDNCNNRKGYDENGNFIRLAYPEDEIDFAFGVIVIGGNTLARGLTLNGLTTSYFARNVTLADSLMQMGRWFGYRTGYELLPRIWITDDALFKFEDITYIEDRLREDLIKFDLGTSPEEYAPKIQSSYLTRFSLSSKNKMQSAVNVGATYEKVDDQTVVFEKNKIIQKENYNIAIKFIKNVFKNYNPHKCEHKRDDNIVCNDVPYLKIKEQLLDKMKFYKNDRFFGNINFFFEWAKREKLENNNWDIVIEDGENELVEGFDFHKVRRSKRKKSLPNVIDFGAITYPKDKLHACLYENGIEGSIDEVKKPKLYIYVIDGESKVTKSGNTEDLNFGQDIIGFHIYVPVTVENEKNRKILTQEM